MVNKVLFSKKSAKQIEKVPSYILDKLDVWIADVEKRGLEEVKKIPGYHDEPLKGNRRGQRSIRLNRAYRAIYIILKDTIEFVEIQEVSKHDY